MAMDAIRLIHYRGCTMSKFNLSTLKVCLVNA